MSEILFVQVSDDGMLEFDPPICLDNGGTVLVVWDEDRPARVEIEES